jgi:hypothetical protein
LDDPKQAQRIVVQHPKQVGRAVVDVVVGFVALLLALRQRRDAGCVHRGRCGIRLARPFQSTPCGGLPLAIQGWPAIAAPAAPGSPTLGAAPPPNGIDFATSPSHAALELEQQDCMLELGEGQGTSLEEVRERATARRMI